MTDKLPPASESSIQLLAIQTSLVDVVVVAADQAMGRRIDTTWVRDEDDVAARWKWEAWFRQAPDGWALIDENDDVVAAFAGPAHLLELPSGLAYELKYLEVAPSQRAKKIGRLALSLIAERALECGAENVILGSLRASLPFYKAHGGTAGSIDGWKTEAGLLHVLFPRDRLLLLKGKT